MARRIGAEEFEYWTVTEGGFNKPRQETKRESYRGCWPQFSSSDEGSGTNVNVHSILVGIWIPADVLIDGADDFLVWTRYPDEKYEINGQVARWFDRRGQLKACYVPVERRQ